MINNFLYARVFPFFLLRSQVFVRLIFIILALAASAFVGFVAATSILIPMAAAGLVLGLIGLQALIRWPGVGFPLIVVCSLLVPFGIGTGTHTSINASLLMVVLLIGLWVLDMIVNQQKITILASRPLLPLFLFMISTLISFGFGQLLWFPSRGASITAQIGGASIFLLSAGAFFLAAHRLEERWLKWMVWVFIILSTIYMMGVLMPYLPIRRLMFRIFQRAVMDSLFWTWFTALAFSQMFLNKNLPVAIRAALGVICILSIYTTFEVKQSWTSGWLPSLIAVGVIILFSRPKLAIAGGIMIVLFFIVQSQRASDIIMGGDNEYSLLTRLEAWKIIFQIISRNPLFGVGPSNYYFYTPFFNILGYNVNFNSHNNYIDILAQTGISGLFFFFWFAGELSLLALRLRNQVSEGFTRVFVIGAIGGLAGTLTAGMLGDWIIPFVYNIGMEGYRASVLAWIFLGALVMIERQITNRKSQQVGMT